MDRDEWFIDNFRAEKTRAMRGRIKTRRLSDDGNAAFVAKMIPSSGNRHARGFRAIQKRRYGNTRSGQTRFDSRDFNYAPRNFARG